MARRPMMMLLLLSACGDGPVAPLVEPVSARAINLSGLPGEIAIWMDGEVIEPGLVDTQPGQALSLTPGTHTFGYSTAGDSAPELSAEITVPDRMFSLITLVGGATAPELRLVSYPIAKQGAITIRALNVSDEVARVVLRRSTGSPGGTELTMDVDPGSHGHADVPGSTTITIPRTAPTVSPTILSVRFGRPADPPEEFSVLGFALELGSPVSGEVRTVVFHRSPIFMPDVYSF
jgi:hypothetical protein